MIRRYFTRVGHILMDVDSGDMVLDKSTKIEELERNAERLYQEKALSAGEVRVLEGQR